jgi:hypothetical protein
MSASLTWSPLAVQREIFDFLDENGVGATVETQSGGGSDNGDLIFRAHIDQQTDDASVDEAIASAGQQMGSSYRFVYQRSTRILTIYVRQLTPSESIELSKRFSYNAQLLQTPVWSVERVAISLFVGVALLVAGFVKLHALWHNHENGWWAPITYTVEALAGICDLLIDLWWLALALLAAFILFYKYLCGVGRRGMRRRRPRVPAED